MSREMKDSKIDWIQYLPKTWTVKRIKYVAKSKSGKEIRKEDILDDGLFKVFGGGEQIGFIDKSNTQKEDILIGRVGSCGKVTVPDEKVWATDNAIVLSSTDCNYEYLAYCLKSMPLENLIKQTAQPLLTASSLMNCYIPLPMLNEQNQIVYYLNSKCAVIDQAIQKQKDIVDRLTEYKQSTITQMVTRGFECNAKMKNTSISGLAQIPKSWKVIPLKTLFSFSKGLSITKSDLTDEGIKVISYGQIHSKSCDGVHVTNELIRFTENEFKSCNSLAKCGGFIFADTSEDLEGCGNAIYITDEVYGGYHTVVLNPKEEHDYRYLAYLFKTDAWRTELRKQLTEVKVFSITQFALKNMHVILPSYEEMVQIADFLDSKCLKINESIERSNKIIQKLEEYKKALIYNAVTGKIDCRGEVK